MKKKNRRNVILLTVVVVIAVGFFSRTPLLALFNKQRHIPAGEILERCYSLKTGDKIHYRFKGEEMVSFDIRRGGDSMMPARLVPFDEGDFVADDNGEYCLRFGNPLNRPQGLEYLVERLK